MRRDAMREVCLVRALESADGGPDWLARHGVAGHLLAPAEPEGGSPDAGFSRRAFAVLDRLESAGQAWLAPLRRASPWPARLAWIGVGVALLAGLGSTLGLSERRMNLLSFPLLGVLVWNLAVYAVLLLRTLAGARAAAGPLRHALSGWAAWLGRRAAGRGPAGDAVPLRAVTAHLARWRQMYAAPDGARLAAVLHTAAAAFAAGAIGGLHLRGVALEFRAGWESTFLDAGAVHGLLQAVLGPAARLLDMPLPGVAGIEALRWSGGGGGGPAGEWIARYAVTVALAVILPRLVLAAAAAWRARSLAARVRLPLEDAYFRRLQAHRDGTQAMVQVVPYAFSPAAPTRQRLADTVRAAFGDTVAVQVAEAVRYGEEETVTDTVPAAAAALCRVALFSLATTPEQENHGVFAQGLRAGTGDVPVCAMVDAAGYGERVGAAGERRVAERRAAWRKLLDGIGMPVVMLDDDTAQAAASLARAAAPAREGGRW